MKKNFGGMTIDTGNFDEGMKKLVKDIGLKGIGPGLFQAGNALLKDAIYIRPQSPMLVGDLRASARTQGADGMLIKPGSRPPLTSVGTGNKASIRAGFNIEYAAKWHEAVGKVINWSTPATGHPHSPMFPGPKYLEMKMRMFRDRYMRIVGEYIKSVLNKSSNFPGGSHV
jgi:hypothetical protein